MPEIVEGWCAPVYEGLTAPLLLAGVPSLFFALDMLGTLLVALLWWPGLLIGGLLYVAALVGTAYDAVWLDILRAHLRYHGHYQG